MRKRLWLWITLFVAAVLLCVALATGWNVVVVRNYQRFAWGVGLGTLGFVCVLVGLILFFVRLLREMRLTELQSEFIAGVSHELRTPIATLELTAGLLRTGGVSVEETRELWDSHAAELARLKSEFEALLEAARWQAGAAPPVAWEPVNLEDWLTDAESRWSRLLGPESRLTRGGDPLPSAVRLDRRLLGLIFDNLIENSRKFALGPARITLQTQVRSRPRGGMEWELRVRDEGRGFDPEDSAKIFRRFFRARTGAPYAIPGTGLGLYLAGNACRALGLRIDGQSDGLGRGATFLVSGLISGAAASIPADGRSSEARR